MAVGKFYLCSALTVLLAFAVSVTGGATGKSLAAKDMDSGLLQLQAVSQELLVQLKLQLEFENLVLIQPTTTADGFSCPFVAALSQRDEPKLILQRGIENYKQRFPKETLVLRCEPLDWLEYGLEAVLGGLRHVGYLNLENTASKNSSSSRAAVVRVYCKKAFKAGIANVIVLLSDSGEQGRYFICYQYPEVQAKRRFLSTAENAPIIFEPQYRNMQGATLWTQPDLMPSRTMLYFDKKGKLHMMGYVANVVKVFAGHYNATMRFRFPVETGKIVYKTVLENATRNGSLDIATAITYLMEPEMLEQTSYPYDVVKYCDMVPMPKPINRYEVFTHIISPAVIGVMAIYLFVYSLLLLYSIDRLTWTTACTNLEMVRAMVAQCFSTVRSPRLFTKFIIFQISYTCHLVNNMYSAFLQSFLTEPPSTPIPHSVDDVHRAGLKVLVAATDLVLFVGISKANMNSFRSILEVEDDIEKYDSMRTSMNPNYIYPVSDRRWQVFEENQKLFQRRVFYYSDTRCIRTILLMSFPLRPDLPYRDLFDEFILRMHCMGFVQRWTSLTYYWMTKFRFLQFQDVSLHLLRTEKALSLDDFRWLWIGYGFFIAIAVLVLLLEFLKTYFWLKRSKRRGG